jgi:hypothetical protein
LGKPISNPANACGGLSVVDISSTLGSNTSVEEVIILHNRSNLEVLILGIEANTNNTGGISRLRHLLLSRVILILSNNGNRTSPCQSRHTSHVVTTV